MKGTINQSKHSYLTLYVTLLPPWHAADTLRLLPVQHSA